ncbi:dihydroxyacetone kinase subunit DhaK [Kaistia terrae]|uniref:Dihydroxyacetone kinase subunit DhaK n=1 Tax=Kaistia terrae TaxID=537017 RepID=A0ABW0Q2U5_9HYPH
MHGEKGVERTTLKSADELADRIVATIVGDLGLRAGDRVALLVNNLGATPMELATVNRRALVALRERSIIVERAWSGTFLSALEMPGCSPR